jgi:hypothetical protein
MVEGERSTVTDVDSGVPQVTVLVPLLFLAFINDLPEVVSSPVRISADDCLVYRSINKVEDTAALQNDMSALQQWESDWQMMFHPEKCTTIHISKKRNPIHTGHKLHGDLRVSLAANTLASMLTKIYPGMTTYSRHQPKPADQ